MQTWCKATRQGRKRTQLAATKAVASEWHAVDIHPECWKPPDLRVENLKKSRGASALDRLPTCHGSHGDLDNLGPVCVVTNADARELETPSVDVHEQGGVLPIVGVVPPLAERTAGVEPASEAEKATTAKLEALVPGRKAWPGANLRGCCENANVK